MRFVLSLLLVAGTSVLTAADKPNMIFILSDDVAQGDLGCYGNEAIDTRTLIEWPQRVSATRRRMLAPASARHRDPP